MLRPPAKIAAVTILIPEKEFDSLVSALVEKYGRIPQAPRRAPVNVTQRTVRLCLVALAFATAA